MKIDDIYGDPAHVRQWDFDAAGQAGCFLDGLLTTDPGATVAMQRNAAVRALIAAVEPYEAAQAILAAGEPDNGQPREIADPEWIDPEDGSTAPMVANPAWALLPRMIETTDEQGQPQTAPEPRWLAYDAAAATVAGASAVTAAHARWRAGEPLAGLPEWDAWWTAEETVRAELARLAALPLEHDPRVGPFTPDAVFAECKRRILAVASTNTQINMAAARAAGILSAENDLAFIAGLTWIQAMRGACASLIAAADAGFAQDEEWPACPASVVALAAAF